MVYRFTAVQYEYEYLVTRYHSISRKYLIFQTIPRQQVRGDSQELSLTLTVEHQL